MRLKILFAPLAFLIVIIVAIWYIWPTISEVMAKTTELKTSKNNLSTAAEKRNSLESMKATLDKNKEKEDFIMNFMPVDKNEEKIVDGINYLAADSGLSLINISLEDEKKEINSGSGVDSINSAPVATEGVSPEVSSDGTMMTPEGTVPPHPVSKIENINAKVVLSGKYENIKVFLGQVYQMQMFNKIKSLAIEKQSSSGEEGQPSDILVANIEIGFGYMSAIRAQLNEYSSASLGNLDFSSYSKIKEMITEKIPALEEGEKGKSNPFIP